MTPTTRLVARPDVLSCAVGSDGTVLLDPRAGVYLGLEGPAALLWTLLGAPVTVETLCEAVVADFEVSREVCDADVHAFVEDLLRRDLVTTVDDEADGRRAP